MTQTVTMRTTLMLIRTGSQMTGIVICLQGMKLKKVGNWSYNNKPVTVAAAIYKYMRLPSH